MKNKYLTELPKGMKLNTELLPHLHNYEESEVYKNVTVRILRCKNCGDVSIGWERQENTEEL